MIIKRGRISNLTGNAIIYWDIVKNKNQDKEHPFSILAVNFVISALPMASKFLSTSFPPIPFLNLEDIFRKIQNINCDLIYCGKIRFPQNENYLDCFYKKYFHYYNEIVEIYISLFKEKFNFSTSHLNEEGKLLLIQKLSQKIRTKKQKSKYKKLFLGQKIQEVISSLENPSKYNFSYFLSILFKEGEKFDKLIKLYTQKFLAIYHENYENAISLNKKIEKIQAL